MWAGSLHAWAPRFRAPGFPVWSFCLAWSVLAVVSGDLCGLVRSGEAVVSVCVVQGSTVCKWLTFRCTGTCLAMIMNDVRQRKLCIGTRNCKYKRNELLSTATWKRVGVRCIRFGLFWVLCRMWWLGLMKWARVSNARENSPIVCLTGCERLPCWHELFLINLVVLALIGLVLTAFN